VFIINQTSVRAVKNQSEQLGNPILYKPHFCLGLKWDTL
jgi:hypothetical protein